MSARSWLVPDPQLYTDGDGALVRMVALVTLLQPEGRASDSVPPEWIRVRVTDADAAEGVLLAPALTRLPNGDAITEGMRVMFLMGERNDGARYASCVIEETAEAWHRRMHATE